MNTCYVVGMPNELFYSILTNIMKTKLKPSCLKPLDLEPLCMVCRIIQWTIFKFAQIMALWANMTHQGDHQEYDQNPIDKEF